MKKSYKTRNGSILEETSNKRRFLVKKDKAKKDLEGTAITLLVFEPRGNTYGLLIMENGSAFVGGAYGKGYDIVEQYENFEQEEFDV